MSTPREQASPFAALLAAAATQKGAAPPATKDPLEVLLQNAMRWSQSHHGATDPLLQRAQQGMAGQVVQPGQSPPHLVRDEQAPNALAQVAQVTQTGPRAGQARQEVDLGDGRIAHIYFTPDGKRQVQVFRRG
jgi:hypothetical protein